MNISQEMQHHNLDYHEASFEAFCILQLLFAKVDIFTK